MIYRGFYDGKCIEEPVDIIKRLPYTAVIRFRKYTPTVLRKWEWFCWNCRNAWGLDPEAFRDDFRRIDEVDLKNLGSE